ncbi:hypothetical protein [Segetibacter koreensis]|uniref:hypothetical protein n=1 Tax=Segetibacter koreensis TaxID=398037 RepID=UPI0003A4ED5D|nr:hypothetical protein [Segetibacter koreensis]
MKLVKASTLVIVLWEQMMLHRGSNQKPSDFIQQPLYFYPLYKELSISSRK